MLFSVMSEYEWVTDYVFDNELRKILEGMTGPQVSDIPGVIEIVREQLNNDVLDACTENRGEYS